ncbi:hypothetical protein SNE40_005040 [Patella caerulea]|uniref:Amine oxidase n=1 Tax=Patella caerulea TaxID=87958 RepID=A0AAN8KAN6_PATCE
MAAQDSFLNERSSLTEEQKSKGFVYRNELPRAYRKRLTIHYCIIGVLCLVISILIGVIVIITSSPDQILVEKTRSHSKRHHTRPSEAKKHIGVFTEITESETQSIIKYLKVNASLQLSDPTTARPNSNFVHTIELKLAPKEQVLKYLDHDGPTPVRSAFVSIFKGASVTPVVEEYEVGPLPNITYAHLLNTTSRKTRIPFNVRPFSMVEFRSIYTDILPVVAKKANFLLNESYGAEFGKHCGDRCLKFSMTPISSAYLAKGERKAWFWFAYDLEFYTLHPLDFQFLVDMTDINPSNWQVQSVWYCSTLFDSLDELLEKYRQNTINKTRVPYPAAKEEELLTSLHLRGDAFPKLNLEAPRQFEPNGPRYTIEDDEVTYMQWKFTYKMSPTIGLQLFNIRFKGERIAYELSMQEIAVLYAANSPASSMLYFADSAGLFGTRTRGLLPGVDCPDYAHFQDIEIYTSNNGGYRRFEKAMCIFEQNNLMPLRRHRAYGKIGAFYGGLLDINLVVRIVISVINYDYVTDFIFHTNGAVEVKVASTGYLASGFYTPAEEQYGTRIRENVIAHLHHHLFHFKADIDIKGTANRFSTWTIKTENKTDEWSSAPQNWHIQTKIKKSLKHSELSAVHKYNFNHPKYLIFSNANQTDKLGNQKSYRLKINGISKMKLPRDQGFEPSVSWSRYQMAVTKQKDSEYTSSSVYAMWDARDPVVNFQKYLDDNENIVDEDLVSWITLGTYHIPQTEHMPNTPTVGGHLSFMLTPFNYFEEDPSMSSRDAIRISPKDKTRPLDGANVERYDMPAGTSCVKDTESLENMLTNSSRFLFF